MSLPAPPEYIDTLSEEQREKLYDFVEVTHQVLDGASFERDNELSDAELLARALWCTQHLQMDPKALDRFFEDQFGIAAITQGELGPWLALMMMTNVEEQIKAAAGGRN